MDGPDFGSFLFVVGVCTFAEEKAVTISFVFTLLLLHFLPFLFILSFLSPSCAFAYVTQYGLWGDTFFSGSPTGPGYCLCPVLK